MKAILIMIGMVLVVATGVVQNMHENQMVKEAEIQQQKIVVQQGQQAKCNIQWKIDHHGEIPAYKD